MGFGLGSPSYLAFPYYSYGYGPAWSSWYGGATTYSTDPYSTYSTTPAPLPDSQPADVTAPPASGDFVAQGEADFRAGRYEDAARDWQHALVDSPGNGNIVSLLAQSLFAAGQYEQEAGTVQFAMQALPEDQWGEVVKNYRQLYGNVQDYTKQLRALEKKRTDSPEEPANFFLLGYHYGYLGYPKEAVRELDKAIRLQPKDLGAQKLRALFAEKAGLPQLPPPKPKASDPLENPPLPPAIQPDMPPPEPKAGD